MLKIIKIDKEEFHSLPTDKTNIPETIFLVKDMVSGLNSIYIEGSCYGENIDEESINSEIDNIKSSLETFKLANNFDIMDILNS